MIGNKKVLAIIPARGGSKRVVNKNIREVAGIPLIGWTIKDLEKSKYIDHSYVSTDSRDIQKTAHAFNIDADPLRPEELATDHSSTVDVILDIVKHKKTGFDIILLLQPTSPLRSIEDIDNALEYFMEKGADSVISVCEADVHPSWCSPLPEDKNLEHLIKNVKAKRSQDLEKNYRLNGAIYIVSRERLLEELTFFTKTKSYGFIMSKLNSVDIDTEEDLMFAESLLLRKR